jgi:hypothetical protein
MSVFSYATPVVIRLIDFFTTTTRDTKIRGTATMQLLKEGHLSPKRQIDDLAKSCTPESLAEMINRILSKRGCAK